MSLGLARLKFYGQNVDQPLGNVNIPHMGCLAQQLKINRKYTASFL